jgi:ribosome-associated heat shock protein Hsp15
LRGDGSETEAAAGADRQRIDKWLWQARIVRTRADAAALTQAGHVRVNGKRMRAAGHPVRVGDVLTVALDRSVRVVEVAAFSDRRGPAPTARTLYRDLTIPSGPETSAPEADSAEVPPRPENSC